MIKYLVRSGVGKGYLRFEEEFDTYDGVLKAAENMESIIRAMGFGGFIEVYKYDHEDNGDISMLEVHRFI